MNLNEMRKIAGLPLKEDYDPKQTAAEAKKIIDALKAHFSVPVDDKTNDDGSITITINNGHGSMDDGGNPHVVTPKNVTKVIGQMMTDFRAKQWMFTQPVRNEFTVGVKA